MNPRQIFDGYHGDNMTSFWDMKNLGGIKLCIFKVSQGTRQDPKYYEYSRRASVTGMSVGGYHFGSNASGKDQAERFVRAIDSGLKTIGSGVRLMVLDYERYEQSQMTLAQAEEFVKTILDITGVLPVLYYGELLLEQERNGKVASDSILRQCPAWIARYGTKQPVAIKGQDLVMWQDTETGTVPGCANPCDLSRWIGNPNDILAFVAKHGRSYGTIDKTP